MARPICACRAAQDQEHGARVLPAEIARRACPAVVGPTAIDRQRDPGHERGLGRSQEQNRVRQFLRRGGAAKRVQPGDLRPDLTLIVTNETFRHRRVHHAWADNVDADFRCQLHRQHPGHRDHAALRCDISRAPRAGWFQPNTGTDVHDGRAVRHAQEPFGGVDHQERSGEVDRQDAVEQFRRRIRQSLGRKDPRRVDHAIEPAHRRGRLLDRRVDRGRIGHIHHERLATDAGGDGIGRFR